MQSFREAIIALVWEVVDAHWARKWNREGVSCIVLDRANEWLHTLYAAVLGGLGLLQLCGRAVCEALG